MSYGVGIPHCSPCPVKLMGLSQLVQQGEYNLPVEENNQICDKNNKGD